MILSVRLTPNSSKDEIIGWDENRVLKIKVKAKPIEGEANKALIKLLSKTLNIPKSSLTVKKGETSRNKLIEIYGIETLQGIIP